MLFLFLQDTETSPQHELRATKLAIEGYKKAIENLEKSLNEAREKATRLAARLSPESEHEAQHQAAENTTESFNSEEKSQGIDGQASDTSSSLPIPDDGGKQSPPKNSSASSDEGDSDEPTTVRTCFICDLVSSFIR